MDSAYPIIRGLRSIAERAKQPGWMQALLASKGPELRLDSVARL